MERSRFSGTLSIVNHINQLIRVVRLWVSLAAVIAAIVTGCVGYQIGKRIEAESPGVVPFFLRFELFRTAAKLRINQDWMKPNLLRQVEEQNDLGKLAAIDQLVNETWHRMKWAPMGGGIAFVITIFIGIFFAQRERNFQTGELYKRGALCFPAKKLSKLLMKNLGTGIIWIGGVLIPVKLENLSFFFIGRPQQGKTQAILRILDGIMERGDRALIWCAKQEDFITTHFTEQQDHIFCPGDARSIKWSLANDLTSLSDFEDVAARIIPETMADSKGPWNKGAREILTGLMKYWWLNTDRSNACLWRILNSPVSDIYDMLAATPECGRAAGLLEKTESTTAHSFYVTLMVYVKPFELLAKNDGDFSIRSYLKEGTGNIFILSGTEVSESSTSTTGKQENPNPNRIGSRLRSRPLFQRKFFCWWERNLRAAVLSCHTPNA